LSSGIAAVWMPILTQTGVILSDRLMATGWIARLLQTPDVWEELARMLLLLLLLPTVVGQFATAVADWWNVITGNVTALRTCAALISVLQLTFTARHIAYKKVHCNIFSFDLYLILPLWVGLAPRSKE